MDKLYAGVGSLVFLLVPQRLVVGGAYRYVRNPTYLAVAALIVGQALLLGQATLLVYADVFGAVVSAFVLGYEEPTLTRQAVNLCPRPTCRRGTIGCASESQSIV